MCESNNSGDDDDDDEQLPCYFPNYSLKEDKVVYTPSSSSDADKEEMMDHGDDPEHSPSSSPALSDIDKEEDFNDDEPSGRHEELRLSSNCTNNTLTSSILLYSMRRKLFDEGQCYVMDAKLQGNIGRFLNVRGMYVCLFCVKL